VALWWGVQGQGFVRMVNALHNLPYLQAVELTLLGIPLLIHLVWGVQYALSGKGNYVKGDGSTPSIKTARNLAYSWQRITSWILLILLTAHIVKFRFLEYPKTVEWDKKSYYAVTVTPDAELPALAEKFGVLLQPMNPAETVRVLAPEFGTATLLSVRDTFKSRVYQALYTLFVLAACFHAFNGFWTFLLTWGWILKKSAQRAWSFVSLCIMALFVFFGLAAIWGSS
jgi:succinate dehydrogenase / fumarate reductase cytochrome b subunit